MSVRSESHTSPRGAGRWWVPALVVAASLGLTAFATYYAARSVRLKGRQQFEMAVLQAQGAVQSRMETYLALLRAGTAFYGANTNVSRSEFHKFVARLELARHYPGIQGFGFSARLRPEEIEPVVAMARSEGLTNFNVWPTVPGEETHTILYLEPMDKRNLAALGYNMYTEPMRQEAMRQARDTGVTVASGRVTLVQEIEGPIQAGFLIYAPVYSDGGVPPTLEERQKSLVGFIYSPFRAEDLFENVFPPDLDNSVNIYVYDDVEVDLSRLLYKSPGAMRPSAADLPGSSMTSVIPLHVAGHDWTMEVSWKGAAPPGWYLVPLIFFAGVGVTLLLMVLTVLESNSRSRLEVVNHRLMASDQSLREARSRLEEHARELEQRVAERTARLQETIKDLEAVLYHVAHDLRAPVRAMGSFAGLLKEDFHQKLDEKAMEYLDRISNAAARMDRLVYDLLSYGRMAQVRMELEPVALDRAVMDALARTKENLEKHQADFEVRTPMPQVRANPEALTDVLARLIDNAAKFVVEGRPPHVTIWAESGSKVRLVIEDNGIGISPEYHERIFRVFERLHANKAYPGTGIGLAIARKALERMGGRIGVDSEPRRGSRFWIELERVD